MNNNKKSTTKEEPKENAFNRLKKNPYLIEIIIILSLIIFAGTYYYIDDINSRVYIEKAQIYAPIVSVGTLETGVLDRINVDIGDKISKSTNIAKVSGNQIKSNTKGIVVDINNVPGQIITSQNYLIKVVDPDELKIIGRVEEDKGLRYIHEGEKVEFSVDAFGSKKYYGIVDKVVPTSRESDIVFSISDKREMKEFEIIVKFDLMDYPELKNGMSAKMWIYKN